MAKILSIACLLFSLHAYGSDYPSVTLRKQVQDAYRKEVGVRELTGKNDGARVEAYLRSVGARRGQPWCAAFVSFIFQRCKVPAPKSAWSPAFFPDNALIFHRQKKPDYKSAPIMPGQVFGIFFQNRNRIAHVGFVDGTLRKSIKTVEGNTDQAGIREGDGVYFKIRPVSTIYAISDFIQ